MQDGLPTRILVQNVQLNWISGISESRISRISEYLEYLEYQDFSVRCETSLEFKENMGVQD